MIRLTAEAAEDRYAFTLSQALRSFSRRLTPLRSLKRMLELGIENPLHLVEAARQWGVVSQGAFLATVIPGLEKTQFVL
jgi:hypothetical protein